MKKIYLLKFLVLFFVTMNVYSAHGQITVSGTITDENGEPLPGVSIVVKGTTTGAITDIEGKYSVNASATDILVYSFVGYISQEITVGAQSVIDLQMQPDVAQLGEVVVIGYGQIEKKDATGAIASVKAEDFNKGVIVSPEQLFQGRAAGVQITNSSGEPGAGVNVRIRGTSSIRSGNNPLFVVDGVPLSGGETQGGGQSSGLGGGTARNPLNFLNPNDIASVDILKDASATAIYGARGANGVVMITTKKGKGNGVLDFSYSLSISSISKKYDILNTEEYLDGWANFNPGADRENQDFGSDTDWQDEILRTALTHSYNAAYGGGSDKFNYRFSLGYQDQEGIIRNSGLERFTARFNGGGKFLDDRISISSQVVVSNVKDENIPISRDAGFEGDLLSNAFKFNPTVPVLIDTLDFRAIASGPEQNAVHIGDGKAYYQPGTNDPNPAAILAYSRSFTNTLRLLASTLAEIQIIDGLTFTTSGGIDRSLSARKDAFSRDLYVAGTWQIGRLYTDDKDIFNTTWENYFTYKKAFGPVNFTGLAGYSYQRFENNGSRTHSANFKTSDLDLMLYNGSNAGGAAVTNSSREVDEIQSFYGRFNFDVSNKYLLTATLRADGSTRFGGNNQYGVFPALAFKWRVSDENFLPDVFSQLDLRLGWGITGNQEIGHNRHTFRQRFSDAGVNEGGVVTPGSLQRVAFQNPDLKWESTEQISAGIDFGFIDGRLTGSLDFYSKTTRDQLIEVVSAQPAPVPFNWENIEDLSIINSGIELGLNALVVNNNDFSWNVLVNLAYNTNMVEGPPGSIYNTGRIHGQGLSLAFAQRIADGQPLFTYFLREFAGFSEDGTTQLYVGGDVQRFIDKSPLPKMNAGLTNTFTYKDLSLSIFFMGQFGHYVYNNTANAFFTAGSLQGGRNVSKEVIGSGEAPTNSPDVSTRFLEKGDFVRLQNVTLSYNIPLGSFKYISKLNVFVNAQNLFVITDYSGQDPEVNVNKQVAGAAEVDDIPSFGIDYTPYPRSRIFTFGTNISF